MKQSTFKPLPGFNYWVKVKYHPNYRSLLKKFNGETPITKGEVLCAFVTPVNPRKKDGLIAVMHFSRRNFTPEWISHECCHLVNWMVGQSGLDLKHYGSEELSAIATGRAVKEIMDGAPKSWNSSK